MRAVRVRWLILLVASCRAELPQRPDGTSPAPDGAMLVRAVPPSAPSTVPTIAQLAARLPEGVRRDLSTVALVRGDVTDVALRGYRDGTPPSSSVAREIPITVWDDGGELVIAPAAVLAPGRHTLVVGSAMQRATLDASGDDVPVLRRLWPPIGVPSAGDVAVMCGEDDIPAASGFVGLVPAGVALTVRRGILDDEGPPSCVTVGSRGAATAWPMPVALVDGARVLTRLDPVPLERASSDAETPPIACLDHEIPLATLCLLAQDDRLLVRLPATPRLLTWLLNGARGMAVTTSEHATLRGLSPASSHHLELRVRDPSGRLVEGETDVVTLSRQAHAVINEALTYPRGDAATSQWVELVNDGTAELDLTGYALDDGRMAVTLPAAVLPPGGFGLVVRAGFMLGGVDDAPAPDAVLIPVAMLGRGTFTERGTALLLRDPLGNVVSRFPATPEPTRGVSVARVTPDAPDDDPASFVLAGVPTPGAPNARP